MKERTSEERKRVIDLVLQNKREEYWSILKEKIEEWISNENAYLENFKERGMSKEQIEKYNMAVFRKEYLKKFLDINEIIVNENTSLIDMIGTGISQFMNKISGFVRGGI